VHLVHLRRASLALMAARQEATASLRGARAFLRAKGACGSWCSWRALTMQRSEIGLSQSFSHPARTMSLAQQRPTVAPFMKGKSTGYPIAVTGSQIAASSRSRVQRSRPSI